MFGQYIGAFLLTSHRLGKHIMSHFASTLHFLQPKRLKVGSICVDE